MNVIKDLPCTFACAQYRRRMAKMKQYQNVDDYLADHSEPVREKLKAIRSCILAAVPDAIEQINYNIPAYALIEGGKRDQQIMIAGYLKHVSLYPHPDTILHFADELAPYKLGKGTVQFDLHQSIPEELIIRMVQFRKQQLVNSL